MLFGGDFSFGFLFRWWVDPGGGWQFCGRRPLAFEAVGVFPKRDIQTGLTGRYQVHRQTMVNAVSRHVCNATVAVLVVVPGKEGLAMSACVFDAAKALGEVGVVFECFGLRL